MKEIYSIHSIKSIQTTDQKQGTETRMYMETGEQIVTQILKCL